MPSGVYDHYKKRKDSIIINWDALKDLEYYPDRFCACGCGGRILVKPHHKFYGIPKYISHHFYKDRRSYKGINNPHFGKCQSKESCEKMSISHKGKIPWNKDREIILREMRICECGCGESFRCKVNSNQRFINGHSSRNRSKSKEMRKKLSFSRKKLWQDPVFVAEQMRTRYICPNKPEKFIYKLLQQLFPNQYKFVGDGKDKDFIIAGKCSDFININGQKKIIEMFGDYWHGEKKTGIPNEQHEQERIDLFAQHGYQTLIIWEHELEDSVLLEKKLEDFSWII